MKVTLDGHQRYSVIVGLPQFRYTLTLLFELIFFTNTLI